MIPLEVKIKNFLSYGSELQTINFENHHLICFTGKNGHGKSALLDAITWALWGQARKIGGAGKADQGLVRLGQLDMMVVIDFLSNGNKYRIKREFLLGKTKSQQYLEFGIYQENSDYLKPLTDKTIRATQEVINKCLGLDYETFINSAFIRQGQSNEFSTKSPKERKEILGTILGLERFEKIRKLILEQQRAKVLKLEQFKNNQTRLLKELEKEVLLLEELENLKKNIVSINQEEQNLTQKTRDLTISKEQLLKAEHEQKLIAVELNHLKKLYTTKSNELNELIKIWRNINQKRSMLSNSTDLFSKKQQLEEQRTQLDKQNQEYLAHKELLFSLKEQEQKIVTQHEQNIIQNMHNVDLERERLASKEHLTKTQRIELAQQKNNLIKQLEQLNGPIVTDQEVISAQNSFEKKQETFTRLAARLDTISKELIKTRKRNSLVTSKPHCPLCEQSLKGDYQQELQKKLDRQANLFQHQQQRLSLILQTVEPTLQTDKIHIQKLQKYNAHETKRKELLATLQGINQREQELANQEKTLMAQTEKLTSTYQNFEKEKTDWRQKNLYYQEVQLTLTKITTKIESLTIDQKHYITLINELKKIDLLISDHKNINDEINNQQGRKAKIHELCNVLRENKKEYKPLEKKLSEFNQEAQSSENLDLQEKTLVNQIRLLNNKKIESLEKKGRIEEQCLQMKKYKEQASLINQEIKTIEKEHQSHNAIATALGRDGVQALLIEEALPEIEDETNRILSRLTDNTQQIFIESLRDLKSGGTKETLDIKISDTQGIRAYELFSGGEAFRIDFALRIAISKLLARRAGASLQTLIIDEGFGSQDEEGLSRIMDSLHKIQEDFAKVIIVSHLPTVQHQLPTQFHITKGTLGSQIQIIEQG